ncbi:MAG TPA: tetratricopeptide repeat protein, partial [Roseiflexaceae bacterium]|nr:tetratricopeptide repeat protein [Roseiflexaceae bacterium]
MATPRFRLLGAIREFAQQQLEQSGHEYEMRRRYALAFFQLVSHTRERYERGQVDAFMPIHEELDNLRAALEWALYHDMIVEAAETVVRLEPFWSTRMPVTLQWLEALLAQADKLSPTLRARVLGLTALLSWEMFRDPAHARALCVASLDLYRAAGDRPGIARALAGLAHLAMALGEINEPQTAAYLAESLQVWRSLNDGYGIAETLIIHGRLSSLQGNFEQARALMNEALALRRSQGQPLGIAIVLAYLSWLAFRQGNYVEMEVITAERMSLERIMGNPQGIADCELWHGVVALWQGRPAQAAALLESSLARLRELGEPRNVLHVLDVCAHAAQELGNVQAA